MFRQTSLLFSLVVLININFTLSQESIESKTDSCPTNASSNIWSISPGRGVSYFYLRCQKAFVTYNKKYDYATSLNGDTNTMSIFNTKTGVGGVINLKTNMVHPILDDLQTFNMSQIEEGNYENISALYDYGARRIPYVTGDNATNPALLNLTAMMVDCYKSANISLWPYYSGRKRLIKIGETNFQPLVDSLNNIFRRTNIPVTQGPWVLLLIVSDLIDYINSMYMIRFQQEMRIRRVINEIRKLITRYRTRVQFKRLTDAIRLGLI